MVSYEAGIELTTEAWEASVLPLNYARSLFLMAQTSAEDLLFVVLGDLGWTHPSFSTNNV
jgi:hypothetical protein